MQVIQGFIHDDHEDLINKHVMMIRVTVYAIHIHQTKHVETEKICNFFTFICHSCLYRHCTYVLKPYININRFNYQNSLMLIIVCLFMGEHVVVFIRICVLNTALGLLGCISPDMCIACTLVLSSLIVFISKLYKVLFMMITKIFVNFTVK
jgi:hypothetical protein